MKTLILLMSLAAVSAQAAELVHNPVLSAAAGQDLEIEAALSGAPAASRVRLYFRAKGKELFKSVEMTGTPSSLRGRVPGKNVEMSGLEYYMEASAAGAAVASSPESNPKLNPHFVTVRKDETQPELDVLSPMDGGDVETSQPVITVAFEDADSGIDPESVLVKIDGEPVKDKGNVQSFDTLVSYLPSKPLSQGEHEVVVVVRDRSGNPGSVKWSFTVKSDLSQKEDGEAGMRWDGNLGYQTQYAHVLTQPKQRSAALPYQPYGLNRADVEVTGRGSDDTYRLRLSKGDDERQDQQPSDRYLAMVSNEQGIIALGDYSPNFSELSLHNLAFLRGATLDLRSGPIRGGHTRLVGVFGQTRRAVEQGYSPFSPVPGPATFAQWLYGARWEFGGKYFQMAFNNVTVNDDPQSVKNPGGAVPVFNTVNTADVKINITPIYLSLFGEGGVNLLGNGPTLLGTSLGSGFRAGLDLNVLPSGTRARFEWRDLGGGFGLLPGGYVSVASSGIIPDYRGYESSLEQSLFDGQFSISVANNRWRDNLQGTKPTTVNDYLAVFSNIQPNNLPYLSLGYSQSKAVNDAPATTLGAFAPVSNQIDAFNATLGYTYSRSADSSVNGNLTWVSTGFKDAARSSPDLSSSNIILSSYLVFGRSSFNVSASFGSQEQPGLVSPSGVTFGARTGGNNAYNLRWNQQWVPQKFGSFVSVDIGATRSDTKAGTAAAAVSNSNRATYSLGCDATPAPAHRLSASFSLANVAMDSKVGAVASDDAYGQLLSRMSYNYAF